MYRLRAALAAAAALLTVLTACGDSGSGNGGSGKGKGKNGADRVEIGALAIVDNAPVHLARTKGFFAKHGIEAKITSVQNGAVSIPGVVGGRFDFGFANATSLLTARERGLPLKVVANGVASTGRAGPRQDYSAVVVAKDSPVKSARQLAGRTIAVNQLKNIGDTTIRATVRKAGADPSTIKFVEMPLPDMNAALASGRVDAIWTAEPFMAQAVAQGSREVAWPFAQATPDLTVSMYFTTDKLVRERPDLARRFTAAINESLAYAQSHPQAVRDVLPTYTKIPPQVIPKIVLPKFPTRINRDSLQAVADLARGDGVLTKRADLDALLP